MLIIEDTEVIEQSEHFLKAYQNAANAPFLEDGFVRKSFPVLEKMYNKTYPYTVRIPKSLREMAAGDFTPAKEIVIEKPIEGPFGHVWFGDSSAGAALRFGYINGDSRYVCSETLGDKLVHGILVGATGQGKSVTLNAAIYGLCLEYAPWEVKLTLSDAKIVEFKDIAKNNPMPHIDTVAATGDVDYLLSVLKAREADMILLNSVFTTASTAFGQSIKKIEDFRKVTGLTLPQNILIFDEFQTMFKTAKKLAPQVVSAIDSFARLGRNTGYHLFLTSQELGNDIPKATLGNISMRCAMGCTANVSEMILGNAGATANMGKKGYLLLNSDAEKHNMLDNRLVRVPYMPPDQASVISSSLIKLGHEFGVTPVLKFYDEQAVLYEDAWKQWLNSFPVRQNTIYLGEPSFIMEDAEQCVKLVTDGKNVENLFVLTPNSIHLKRMFLMLKQNVERSPKISNIVMCANSMFSEECGAKDLSPQFFFEENNLKTSMALSVAANVLFKRKLCLQADTMVFADPRVSDVTDAVFYNIYERGSAMDTLTNRSRIFYYNALLNSDAVYAKYLDVSDEKRAVIFKTCLQMCESYGAASVALTYSKMPPVYVWMLGVDRILGMVRDPSSREHDKLKAMMLEGSPVSVRFVMFSTTFEELNPFNSAVRWFLLDDVQASQLSKIKCDCYPEQKSGGLAVVWDSVESAKGALKFKKMLLNGEIPAI